MLLQVGSKHPITKANCGVGHADGLGGLPTPLVERTVEQ
jgi:hypothetical protein